MSTISSPPPTRPPVQIPPLQSKRPDGKPYERSAAVLEEIGSLLTVDQALWLAKVKRLRPETLIFLIRYLRLIDRELMGLLLLEVSERIFDLVKRWTRSFDPISREDIASRVEMHVIKLLLSEDSSPVEPSREADSLEISFAQCIELRVIDALRSHKRSALRRRGYLTGHAGDWDSEAEAAERPIELADDGPSPEDIVVEDAQQAEQRKMIREAYAALDDPNELLAVILHVGYGWPISSQEPGIRDVARFLNVKPRQAKYLVQKGLRKMRAALTNGENL